jgi:multiple RNA-binding domain-containing protein 1
MQRPSQSKTFLNEATEDADTMPLVITEEAMVDEEDKDELQTITKKSKVSEEEAAEYPPRPDYTVKSTQKSQDADHDTFGVVEPVTVDTSLNKGETDADWLRSRTSRVLGLVDDEDGNQPVPQPIGANMAPEVNQIKSADSSAAADTELADADEFAIDADEQIIRNTRRLYLRNLPYTIIEDDVTEHFAAFDGLEEVWLCDFPYCPQLS